jgi:CRISPR-associated endoribonuclease Cas6
MIQQFQFIAEDEKGNTVPSFLAYRIYSALMEKIPAELAEYSHAQGYTPFSQYLRYDQEEQKSRWTISLLDDAAVEALAPLLSSMDFIELHGETIRLSKRKAGAVLDAEDIVAQSSRRENTAKKSLLLPTVTSFKSNGRYMIFPSEEHILQSLIRKWNSAFPQMTMEDEDAFRMLLQGIHIRDYRFKSAIYRLKDTSIPGFVGEIGFQERLSPPMMELWKMLLLFAEYSGLGIKTALGMGGTVLRIQERQPKS